MATAGKKQTSSLLKASTAKPHGAKLKDGTGPQSAELVEMKVTLENVTPAVVRELTIPTDISLGELHDVLQLAMGWEDCHMHNFCIPGTRESFGDTSMFDGGGDMEDEEDSEVQDLLARGVKKIIYTYDFGDDWKHTIVFGKAVAASPEARYPLCTSGQGDCPPEDSGGPWGYADKLTILADPKHADYQQTRDWIGPFVMPGHFSADEVNARLRPRLRLGQKSRKIDERPSK